MYRTAMIFLILTLCSCGDGSSGEGDTASSESAEVLEAEVVPALEPETESGTEEAPESNPIMSTQIFGQDGNLWKPFGDPEAAGAGRMVVLLSAQFTEQFDSCEIRTRSGAVSQLICIDDQPWTQIPFSCFSNGNRQTWRATFPCSEAAEVRVVCRDFNQEVTFTVPEASRGQVCSRFG